MPQVHEYVADAQVGGPFQTRQARTLDSGGAGAAIAGVGNALVQGGQQLHKQEAQAEITRLNAQMSKMHADFSTSLDDTLQNSDPNDDKIAEDFMSDYDDKMAEVSDTVKTPEGRRYFEEANARMRGHFQVASIQGQSTLAGEKAVQDQKATTDNFGASLYNDPSALPQVIEQHAMGIQALVENGVLSENKANELQAKGERQLVEASIRGWMNPDGPNAPEKAIQVLKSGVYDKYLDGNTRYQLNHEAETAKNAKRIEEERRQKQAGDVEAQRQEAFMSQSLVKMYSNDGLSTNEVLRAVSQNVIDFAHGKQLLSMIEADKGEKLIDHGLQSDIFSRIHLPDGDPRKITDPDVLNTKEMVQKLGLTWIMQMRNEIAAKKTPDGEVEGKMKSNFIEQVAKGKLLKTSMYNPIASPGDAENYQAFLSAFLPEYERQRKAGKTPVQLLSPDSPDYLGKMIDRFYKTPEQRLREGLIQNGPSAPAQGAAASPSGTPGPVPTPAPRRKVESRLPGESISQWKARTGQ